MADYRLIGKDYATPDLVAKATGRAKYAEDFRAEGMLFTKLLLSPMPHGRVRSLDTSRAMAMPGVEAILTADDLPEVEAPDEQMLTNEPLYEGEPILAVAAVPRPFQPRPLPPLSIGLRHRHRRPWRSEMMNCHRTVKEEQQEHVFPPLTSA